MTHDPDEIRERVAACIERYRCGEIGPISFEALMLALRVPRDEVSELQSRYRDECRKNRCAP